MVITDVPYCSKPQTQTLELWSTESPCWMGWENRRGFKPAIQNIKLPLLKQILDRNMQSSIPRGTETALCVFPHGSFAWDSEFLFRSRTWNVVSAYLFLKPSYKLKLLDVLKSIQDHISGFSSKCSSKRLWANAQTMTEVFRNSQTCPRGSRNAFRAWRSAWLFTIKRYAASGLITEPYMERRWVCLWLMCVSFNNGWL